MIESIKTYLQNCPYLTNYIGKVDYLVDRNNFYSIAEEENYNPIINDTLGFKQYKQFRFNIDIRLKWCEDDSINIANTTLFNNFSKWLREQDNNSNYPTITNVEIESIKTITNGYLYVADNEIAIYRISCEIRYYE